MNVFVASWFFPPNSSSEGFVTYKLLRNSSLHYDVVCSTSHKWGYGAKMTTAAENIRIIPIETEDLEDWAAQAIEQFELNYSKRKYDVIMTRSMPPDAIKVGLAIKERHPEIKWVASFGDPVANNPYSISAIAQGNDLDVVEKGDFIREIASSSGQWSRDWRNNAWAPIRIEAGFRVLQDEALAKADMLICPVEEMRDFMLHGCVCKKPFCVIPHSFDEELYGKRAQASLDASRINLVYIGYSDARRSLLPVVRGLHELTLHYPEAASRICFHVFGNYPHGLQDYAESYQLPRGMIAFHGNCTYYESLAVMRTADWLLHVDAFFGELMTGGSIYFAGKLADYFGAGKPILALTGNDSPAYHMVRDYGGMTCQVWEPLNLLECLRRIASGNEKFEVNADVRSTYAAKAVAHDFDEKIRKLFAHVQPATGLEIYALPSAGSVKTKKLMTVCVPCYNAEQTLDRCLHSLVSISTPEDLEIIVVDDGSRDGSAEIARRYVDAHPGVVKLVRKPNGGHGSGVNTGIDHGTGLYYRVVDSDDWVDSNALQRLLDVIRREKDDPVDVYYTNYHVVNAKDGSSWEWPKPEDVEYGRHYRFGELDTDKFYLTMHGSVFRMELLRKSGLRCHEHCFYVDSEYILKPIPFVKTLEFLDLYVYKYWQGQEGQSVSTASFVKNYENHATVMRSLIEYYKTQKMPSAQRRYFYRLLKEHLITHYRIMMEFDSDRSRGAARKREFDRYLCKVAPDLFAWNSARLCYKGAFAEIKTEQTFFVRFCARILWLVKQVLPYGMVRCWQKRRLLVSKIGNVIRRVVKWAMRL